jgi:hypothetical protein
MARELVHEDTFVRGRLMPPPDVEESNQSALGRVEGDRVDAALEALAASPYESVWELENRARIGPRPVGPVAKLQPSPGGLGINSQHRPSAGGAAPRM